MDIKFSAASGFGKLSTGRVVFRTMNKRRWASIKRHISRQLKVFEHAAKSGNVAFICAGMGSRQTYYFD